MAQWTPHHFGAKSSLNMLAPYSLETGRILTGIYRHRCFPSNASPAVLISCTQCPRFVRKSIGHIVFIGGWRGYVRLSCVACLCVWRCVVCVSMEEGEAVIIIMGGLPCLSFCLSPCCVSFLQTLHTAPRIIINIREALLAAHCHFCSFCAT